MAYVGGSLTSLFDRDAQIATGRAVMAMAERGGDRMVEVTVVNTPIGGRGAFGGVGGGNLRTSWYQIPTHRVTHPLGRAFRSGVASDVDYAPHVEYGTGLYGPKGAKYLIEPKKAGGWLHWRDPKTGEDVFARRVWHPGSPGQFMVATAATVVEYEAEHGLFDAILQTWVQTVESGAD